MLFVACRESGDRICSVESVEQGIEIIKAYEKVDTIHGYFEPNFYDVINAIGESVKESEGHI